MNAFRWRFPWNFKAGHDKYCQHVGIFFIIQLLRHCQCQYYIANRTICLQSAPILAHNTYSSTLVATIPYSGDHKHSCGFSTEKSHSYIIQWPGMTCVALKITPKLTKCERRCACSKKWANYLFMWALCIFTTSIPKYYAGYIVSLMFNCSNKCFLK